MEYYEIFPIFSFQAYRDYSDACLQHIQMVSNQSLAQYYEAHNAYVQQLRGTNSMLKEYHAETLPALLQVSEWTYKNLYNPPHTSIQSLISIHQLFSFC